MKKRGQLTIFIILGILLLLAFALFFALRERAVVVEEYAPKISEVPLAGQALNAFVTGCLAQTAEEGLRRMGDRGGYLDPPRKINPVEPTEGDAVQLAPMSELAVPYWWHLASKNTCAGNECVFASQRPPLLKSAGGAFSIEAQLDSYVEEHVWDCLGDFGEFARQGFTIARQGALDAKATIARKNVYVELAYPLEVVRGEETFALRDFVAELDVNLYEMYQLATNITQLQAEQSFLENHARNLIDVFSRASNDALPPVSEMEFDLSPSTFWIKREVAEKLAGLLASYTPLLQVHNTKSARFLEAPANARDPELYEILHNRGMLIPLPDLYPELGVRFAFLDWWKPYFDLNCRGQLCRAEGFVNTFGFLFGLKRYAFAYDLSWPVLVDITNPQAFGGKGFTFRFVLEGNLRNNVPLSALAPVLDVPQLQAQTTLLCEPAQRTGGNITIDVQDDLGRPVPDADISLVCGTETCGIGQADAQGKLTEQFPRCLGGFVSASTPDHYPAYAPLDVVDESAQQKTLSLPAYRNVDVRVKKYVMKKGLNWLPDMDNALAQSPTERTIIILERKTRQFEESFTTVAEVCGGPAQKARIPCGDPPSDSSQGVRILPGTYDVKVYSFNYADPAISILPQRRCFRTGSFPTKKTKCICVPSRPITFNQTSPLYSGYAELEWTVTPEELENVNFIEFYYLNFALDRIPKDTTQGCVGQRNIVIEDLDALAKLNTYSAQYANELMPAVYRK